MSQFQKLWVREGKPTCNFERWYTSISFLHALYSIPLKLCIRSRPSFLITSYLSLSMPFRDLKPNISTNQTHLASIMKPVSFLESYLLMIPPFYSSPQAISSFHSLFISHFYYCQWLRIKHYPMNSTFHTHPLKNASVFMLLPSLQAFSGLAE